MVASAWAFVHFQKISPQMDPDVASAGAGKHRVGAEERSDLAAELQVLYEQVPATRCAQSGECCVLTDEEFNNDYATMFPLYRAEYENILRFVKKTFGRGRRRELLGFTEERPRRCPFLGRNHSCTIYPVRPLICRTYAVMNHRSIAAAAEESKGEVPQDWIDGFVLRESSMVCPRVEVVEPEKLEGHARNLIDHTYERILTRLSRLHDLLEGERLQIFQHVSRGRAWPMRWTWGGFNAIRSAPLNWMRSNFDSYWQRSELPDAR